MSRLLMIMLLGLSAVARGEVVVELVPDPPGPYVGGETVTVNVWLHNEVDFDVQIYRVRLDFDDSHSALVLQPTFSFDYSMLTPPHGYDTGTVHNGSLIYGPPLLPVCFTENGWSIGCYPCPDLFYVIPPGESYYLGNIAADLPTARGSYTIDVLNAGNPNWYRGAQIWLQDAPVEPVPIWTAYDGEVTGGRHTLVVSGPIPVLSAWGSAVMTCLLAIAATLILRRGRCPIDAARAGQGTGE